MNDASFAQTSQRAYLTDTVKVLQHQLSSASSEFDFTCYYIRICENSNCENLFDF